MSRTGGIDDDLGTCVGAKVYAQGAAAEFPKALPAAANFASAFHLGVLRYQVKILEEAGTSANRKKKKRK